MDLTVDRLINLLDQLPLNTPFRFASERDSSKLEIDSIDKVAKTVTVKRYDKNGNLTPTAPNISKETLEKIARGVKEKVAFTEAEILGTGGSNRAVVFSLLCYTKEFYYSKYKTSLDRTPKAHFVWLPSDTHTSGTLGKLTLQELEQKCGKSQTILENIILYGPPGTGKTYDTKERAVKIIDGRYDPTSGPSVFKNYLDQGRIVVVTFHQSYAYEDFVEGIQVDMTPGSTGYVPKPGVFQKICQAALEAYDENPDNPANFVLIIDEINRGNISKIFGELITLIEPSKRIGAPDEMTVTLPYSQASFGVPKNLFIIGTMNSADKSISVIDSALRRRFRFVDYEPKASKLGAIGSGNTKVDLAKILDMINRRITALLDKDHAIGHTYFMEVSTLPELAVVFRDKIIPLLQETFFNNMQEVRLVLNGGDGFTKNPSNQFFVEEPKFKHKDIFGKVLEEHDQKDIYVLNPLLSDDKLDKIKPAFFKAIYEKTK